VQALEGSRIKPVRVARAPAVSDRTHRDTPGWTRANRKADDPTLSFQKNPSRTPERIKFLITNFAIERTKARRR
jgi:hypothetical protein